MTLPAPKDAMRGFLAIAVLTCTRLALFWLLKMDVPDANRDIVNMLIGALAAMTANTMHHYFGTSKSSADKNDLIRDRAADVDHVSPDGAPVAIRHARPLPEPTYGAPDNPDGEA